MRNFYRQGPPPMGPYNHYRGPGRMPGYGFPPPHRYNPGMIPPAGPKGVSKIESFMETCNRLLATAQGFQPYIAQATPLLRNLPAIWRLYKGFSSKGEDKGDDYEHESSEFNLDDSSSFEYVYKDDQHNHKPQQTPKHEHKEEEKNHHHEKPTRARHEPERKAEFNHKGFANRFFPIRHERRHEPVVDKPVVQTLKKPYKTKPSVPRIFQPTFHIDE